MAFRPIEILINAKDEASAVFGRLQTKVAAVGVAIAGYFGIKTFGGAVKSAADFEAAMSRVEAATGATGQELEDLKKAASDSVQGTGYKAIEAAGALENLAKAGLSGKEAIQALNPVLSLAAAADVELATAAEYVTKAVMGMGLSFDDAGRVADVLAKGANASNTSVTGLAEALSYTAPIAKSVGVSLEQTVAMIGKLADGGIDASRAGTALNNILAQFSDPASKFKRELAAAGITTTDFGEALRQLEAVGPKGEMAIRAVGLEAGPSLRSLLNQGTAALDGLTKKLQEAQGSAAKTAQVMRNNLDGSLRDLSSTWTDVEAALATPVLPTLTKGVRELVGALRTAIADGTVGRFGETFKLAFESGIKGIKDFLATLDVNAIVAKLQAWAGQAQATFASIAEYARNAGATVQTAWGVMSAGTNTVLAAIYKVAEAFAGVASNIQSGLAIIMEGFAKVTFGSVSASFSAAAAEIRLSAEATWAVSEAFADKASAAFDAAAKGAETAQNGWAGLTASAEAAAPAMDKVASSADRVAKSAEEAAKAQDKQAQEAIKNKAAAEENAAAIQQLLTQYADLVDKGDLKAAEVVMGQVNARMSAGAADATSSAQAIATLRQEYDALIAKGDLQAAALKMEEINRQMAATGQSAATAVASAKAVEDAFTRLGITSTQSLENLARQAQADFELIRDSGTASTSDIRQAFFKAAQAAIDAADGVAPAWVRAEAGMRGYAVQVDQSGKAVLKLASEINAATSATGNLQGVWNGVGAAIEDAAEKAKRVKKESADAAEAQRSAENDRVRSMSISMGGDPAKAAYDFAKGRGASDAVALQYAEAYMSGKAGGFGAGRGPNAAFAAVNYESRMLKELDQMMLADVKQKADEKRAAKPGASTSTSTAGWGGGMPAGAQPGSSSSRTINLQIGGRSLGAVTTDAAGEQALESLLSELERSAFVSGGVR